MAEYKIGLANAHAQVHKEIIGLSSFECEGELLDIMGRLGFKVFTTDYTRAAWGTPLDFHNVLTIDIPFDTKMQIGDFERKLDLLAYDLNVAFAGAKSQVQYDGFVMDIYEGQHYEFDHITVDEYEDLIETQEKDILRHKANLELIRAKERMNRHIDVSTQ